MRYCHELNEFVLKLFNQKKNKTKESKDTYTLAVHCVMHNRTS